MEVYPCGTKVKTEIGNVEAIITAFTVRFMRVSYEVSYFLHGEYKTAYLDESEFCVEANVKKQKVGFRQ